MIHRQFIRYAVIGLLLNGVLYGAYLALVRIGMGSKVAMTGTYCSGILIGFLLNRKVTFRYVGDSAGALGRYIASYVFGYVIDLLGLLILSDQAGIDNEIVQGGMTIALPVLLFAMQKYWVFPDGTHLRPVSQS